MTIPQIRIDDYGIIVTDADGETINISAEDALNLANQIYARKPLLEAIIERKKAVNAAMSTLTTEDIAKVLKNVGIQNNDVQTMDNREA